MAQYATLKAAIDAVIKANGQKEITGTVLNEVLTSMVNSLGANYQLAGVATPSTNPGTPDQNVFYLAFEAGTYTNFNATVLSAGISILMWNGSWASQTFYTIDATPTASSNNLVSSGAVFDAIKTDGSAYDVSAHFPTGGPDSDGKFTLEYILSNANTLIPAAWRKGGMSIKFVHSSDNKYVRWNLLADEFTTDITQWAIADEGVYVENPEFVYVKTDGEGKIVWAIRTDGDIFYGAGVPSQVVNYINEKIAELSLDEYEDIVAFLDDLEKGDKTLQDLLNEKVDKVTGKSLIDAEYASTKSTIDNPEYLKVTTDSEDKVLEGIQADGTKVIGGDLKVLGNMEVSGVSYKVIENPEYLAAWVDVEDKIVFGLKTDGKTYVGDADFLNDIKDNQEAIAEIKTTLVTIGAKVDSLDIDALSSITATENPEYIEAKTDSEDKLLAGRTSDGAAFENVGFATPKVSIGGHIIENIEDPEGRSEIKIDSEDKIISFRKPDGTKVENVGIEATNTITDSLSAKEVSIESGHATLNSLELTEQGMSDFQQALKDSGFKPGGAGNFSDAKVVELPEPVHYALLNLIVDSLPLEDEDISEGYAEYYDKAGNYWKKPIELAAQGQSSRIFARTGGKGNYTMDIVDDSEIKFGSWVPQNSFHLKGCAKDVVRGILPTSYKWAYMFMEYLDAKPNRVLLKDDSEITTTHASGDRFTDWPTDARCIPDGFPVEVYINGEYWGLYSWQLKKHRKNYSMDKKDYSSCFIDADDMMTDDYAHGIWNDGPDDRTYRASSWWTGFDIKGPKDLICMDGSKFDGDHPKELIDNTSEYYDASNKAHKGSAQTKAIIRAFQTKYLEVKTLIDNNNIDGAKAKFNDNFDYNACMLVYIFNCLMRNIDSVKKNTLWGTYKDGKVFPALWDLDGMYGQGWIGNTAVSPAISTWNTYANAAWPLGLFWTLYESEIKAVYAELRRNDIISINTWKTIVFGWVNRIGTEAYDRDIEKWPETPSYRENYTNTDYWTQGSSTTSTTYPLWDENETYQVGAKVRMKEYPTGTSYSIIYTAVAESQGVCPVTKFYEGFPLIGGFFDSPKRWEKWMISQIELCDNFMGYTE